jgi:hypothetical protein
MEGRMNKFIEKLKKMNACTSAIAWCEEKKFTSITSAWEQCDNPRWMIWYAGMMSGKQGSFGRRKLAKCCAKIARLVLPFWHKKYPSDKRPLKAIEAAEKGKTKKVAYEAAKNANSIVVDDNHIVYVAYASAHTAEVVFAADASDVADAVVINVYGAITRRVKKRYHRNILLIVRKFYPIAPRNRSRPCVKKHSTR